MRKLTNLMTMGCLLTMVACQNGTKQTTEKSATVEEVLEVPECIVTTPPDSLHL